MREVCTRLHQALPIAGSGGGSIFLHPFLHAQNRPDLLSPPLFPSTTSVRVERETQAVQSRFATGNTHLRAPYSALSSYRFLDSPSADEPSDITGLTQ